MMMSVQIHSSDESSCHSQQPEQADFRQIQI